MSVNPGGDLVGSSPPPAGGSGNVSVKYSTVTARYCSRGLQLAALDPDVELQWLWSGP